MAMTSKERVRAAFSQKTPDRVPSFLNGVDVIQEKLIEKLGVDNFDEVLDKLDIDVRNVDAPYIGPELPVTINEDGQEERTHWFGFKEVSFWNGVEYNSHNTYYPLDEMETIEDLEAYAWPDPDWFDYDALAKQCDKYEGRALRIGWPGVYQIATHMMSAEKLYMEMALNPEFVQYLFDRLVDFELEYYGRMFEASKGRIDILKCCDDYGTQTGMLFGKDMWLQFFERNTKRLADLCHKHNAFYLQHSCGAISEIIPCLIDCGVDGLDPIQKVIGMEPENLQENFGGKICFHGGIDTQHLLPHGKPEEVKAESENFIDILGKQSGFILGPSQDFEGDVPVENVLAVYEARNLA